MFFDASNNVLVVMTTSTKRWNVIKFNATTPPISTSFNLIMNSIDTEAVGVASLSSIFDEIYVGGLSRSNVKSNN